MKFLKKISKWGPQGCTTSLSPILPHWQVPKINSKGRYAKSLRPGGPKMFWGYLGGNFRHTSWEELILQKFELEKLHYCIPGVQLSVIVMEKPMVAEVGPLSPDVITQCLQHLAIQSAVDRGIRWNNVLVQWSMAVEKCGKHHFEHQA